MKKIKKVTIDDLAIMVKNGFEGMDKSFEGMDKSFEGMDKRFEGVDKRLEDMDKSFEGMDKKFEGVDKRLDFLVDTTKKGFDEAQKDREKIRKELSKTEGRIVAIIRGDKERNSEFHIKVVEILEKNKLVDKKDVDYLMVLAK